MQALTEFDDFVTSVTSQEILLTTDHGTTVRAAQNTIALVRKKVLLSN